MEWLIGFDPTTVCVALIVVGLTLLWAYVMLAGAKREQPNLSVLYEQPGPIKQAGGSKKGMKNKSKNRQDESGLKSGSTVTRRAKPESDEETSSKMEKESSKQVSTLSQKVPEKEAKTTKSQSKQTRRSRNVAQPAQVDGSKQTTEDDTEGEWQTQLSRQQIRTLRQKQRQSKEASASSDSDSKRTPSSGEEQTDNGSGKTKAHSKSTKLEGQVKGRKKDRGSTREQPKTVSEITTADKEPSKSIGSDLAEPDKQITPEPSSPELRVPKADESVSDVEQALQEAVQSSSPSPDETEVKEEEKQPQEDDSSSPQSPEELATESQEQQTLQGGTDSEDWVVL